MSHRIAYYRVSTRDQSVESQRAAMAGAGGEPFDHEVTDEGISGATLAASRPGLGSLLTAQGLRKGDTLYVFAVDRLGRDAIDVQSTVRDLLKRGVAVHVHGLGLIAQGVGELILAVLAQVAAMERARIIERTEAGSATAREHLARTGKTHRGKLGMGRPLGRAKDDVTVDPTRLVLWKAKHGASIAETAAHWKVSLSTVKRYCATAAMLAERAVPKGML
jgi:putative DNA-invertase from lambdoid prophage Rac